MTWVVINNGTYPFIVDSSSGVEYLVGVAVKSSSGTSYTVGRSVLSSSGTVYYPIRYDEQWTTFNSAQAGNWIPVNSTAINSIATFAGMSFSELSIAGSRSAPQVWSTVSTE
jgi:hypothetical protein